MAGLKGTLRELYEGDDDRAYRFRYALLAFDLGVLHRKQREIEVAESLWLSAGYIAVALLFGSWVWWSMGPESGINYLTAFFVEKTLALDNVFVISLIFTAFAIPRLYQHRVLVWGIVGVIVLRAIVIGLGAGLVAQCAVRRTPVLLSGAPGALAAAVAADRLAPGTGPWLLLGCSPPGGAPAVASAQLRLEPLLDLRIALPEGADLALQVLLSAVDLASSPPADA